MIDLTASISCAYQECEVVNGHSVCPAVLHYVRELEKLAYEVVTYRDADHEPLTKLLASSPIVKQNGE